MKFIDLFAGIGGFHQALSDLGHTCVYANDYDKYASKTYENNYGIKSFGDITKVDEKDIPEHDILCAGFPCQSFSVAGKQLGFNDPTKGTLFFDIMRILKYHKPKYILLENVKNLSTHDNGNTWKVIKNNLISVGYRINHTPEILSPDMFGIPQHRERVFIYGYYDPEHSNEDLNIHVPITNFNQTIEDIMIDTNIDKVKITNYENNLLNLWDELICELKNQGFNPSFTIIPDFFNYNGVTDNLVEWKKISIPKNKKLYSDYKEIFDKWLIKFNNFPFTNLAHRKLEWQAGKDYKSVWECIISFRQSGIRIKRPNVFPTLVAVVQTPIYGPLKRRLTALEAGLLQSFPLNFKICENIHQAYKQFGNSVNIRVVKEVAKTLFGLLKND